MFLCRHCLPFPIFSSMERVNCLVPGCQCGTSLCSVLLSGAFFWPARGLGVCGPVAKRPGDGEGEGAPCPLPSALDPLAPARPPLGGLPSHSPVLTTLKSPSQELASQSTPQIPPFQTQLPLLVGVHVLLEGPETLRLSQPCDQMFPQLTVA